MTNVKIKGKERKKLSVKTEAAPELLSLAIWTILSFAASKAVLFGNLAPFGPAAVAASDRKNSLGAAVGAVLGYVLTVGTENEMRYIAAVLIVYGAKLVLERFTDGALPAVLMAFGGMAFSSFGYAALTVISGYGSALALTETVLCGGSAYFFKQTSLAFAHKKSLLTLSEGDKACAVMTAAITAASLTGITFAGLTVGGILASFLVLFSARYTKVSGGAVAGIAVGTAIALTESFSGLTLSGFALGGLFAGIFSVFGKLGTIGAYGATRLLFCLLETSTYPDFSPLYETVIASAAFLLIPERAGSFFSRFALLEESPLDAATVRDLVLSKMGQAAAGLNDVAAATRKVSASVTPPVRTDLNAVLNAAAEEHCRFCPKNHTCWKEKNAEIRSSFAEMGKSLRKGKTPVLSEKFRELCPKSDLLCADIGRRIREKDRENAAERKIRKVRSVVTDQFDGMALLLRDLAAETASIRSTDKKLSGAVRRLFEEKNIPLFASTCYYTVDGCLNVEVSAALERLKNADVGELTEELSDACGCDLAAPVHRDSENARRLIFCEKPFLRAEFGKASLSADGEKYCGDNAESFIDPYSCAHLILSDGMGSGEEAALDSVMACGLTARMMRAGFRFGSAVHLVNSALLLKSEEESLATIDAVSVNLYNGQTRFYKAGAAPSYVLKKGHPSKVETVSLPAGILGGGDYGENAMVLSGGDIIALVTDGVTASGEDWVLSELRCLAEKPAAEIASSLVQTAKERRNDGHSDDITALVMKIFNED